MIELGEQPERDELDADDDEQHAERQQRSVADALSPEPEHGEVREDDEADRSHEQPDAAEEVQRPVPVAAHEGHAQQVEEAAEVALRPVARAAVLARAMVHGDLGDAKAAVRREDRDEAVELAVEAHALEAPRRGTP